MIQRHPIRAPRSAIVPDDRESVVAERRHDLDLLARNRSHAVRSVIGRAGRSAALAEAAQVGRDHVVSIG
jgi:hypothetical protein